MFLMNLNWRKFWFVLGLFQLPPHEFALKLIAFSMPCAVVGQFFLFWNLVSVDRLKNQMCQTVITCDRVIITKKPEIVVA